MTDSVPLPPPVMPATRSTPVWKLKRFVIPSVAIAGLLAVAACAPPQDDVAETPAATATAEKSSTDENLMPDVVGLNLQEAQDQIQEAGVFYSRSEDATGEGRHQVMDRNWIVVGQNIEPGTPFGEGDAVLSVVKKGEEANAAQPATASTPPTTEAAHINDSPTDDGRTSAAHHTRSDGTTSASGDACAGDHRSDPIGRIQCHDHKGRRRRHRRHLDRRTCSNPGLRHTRKRRVRLQRCHERLVVHPVGGQRHDDH